MMDPISLFIVAGAWLLAGALLIYDIRRARAERAAREREHLRRACLVADEHNGVELIEVGRVDRWPGVKVN
jgi:hypothetical protein